MNSSAIVCGCGKTYLTKKLKNKLPDTIGWKLVEGFVPLQNTPKKKKTTVVVASSKSIKTAQTSAQRCPSYGMPNGLFADKGMCWSCYKDMMS